MNTMNTMNISALLPDPLFAASFARLIPVPAATLLISVINLYVLIIFVWAVLSWFRGRGGFVNDAYRALDKIVGPLVKPLRKIIPVAGGMDFSPFVAILLLQLIARILISL